MAGVTDIVNASQFSAQGRANGISTTAAPVIPQATRPSGSISAPKPSFIRKYPAEHAAASRPSSRPSASRRTSCQTSATIPRPAIATTAPAYAAYACRALRTSRTQATTITGAM